MDYEENQINRESVNDVESQVAMTSKEARSKHESSIKLNEAPK